MFNNLFCYFDEIIRPLFNKFGNFIVIVIIIKKSSRHRLAPPGKKCRKIHAQPYNTVISHVCSGFLIFVKFNFFYIPEKKIFNAFKLGIKIIYKFLRFSLCIIMKISSLLIHFTCRAPENSFNNKPFISLTYDFFLIFNIFFRRNFINPMMRKTVYAEISHTIIISFPDRRTVIAKNFPKRFTGHF